MKIAKATFFIALMIFLTSGLTISSCEKEEEIEFNNLSVLTTKGKTEPLYEFSITSNDIDFIKAEDLDAFKSLSFKKQDKKEMPDKRSETLFDENAYVFEVTFDGGTNMEIWCHSSFGSEESAKEYAEKVCPRLGKLPSVQRDMLTHVVIHEGDETAFADNGFFVLYSDNMDTRINNNDLEETVFHESVHASLQTIYEKTPEWKQAKLADDNYITEYAKKLPDLEDMPETALFAYTMIKHPGRLHPNIECWIEDYIPNRLAFFKKIYE